MSGNLCRCAAYPNIRTAIREVRDEGPGAGMRPVSYARTTDVDGAIALVSNTPASAFLAGGTTEVDLARQNVLQPDLLVDINDLPLKEIGERPDGSVRLGALARMSDVAEARGGEPVPDGRPGARSRCLAAAASHGFHGGKSAPTRSLQLLPRSARAVQQEAAGQRLWCFGGDQPRSRDPGHQ